MLNELPKPLAGRQEMSNIKNSRPKPSADRFRNRRTAAGFVSKPCETATTNNAETLPTKRIRSWMSDPKPLAGRYEMSNIKNHAKQRPRTIPKRCLRNALKKKRKNSRPQARKPRTAKHAAKLNRNKKPMPCETVARKTLETSPLERIAERNS